MAALLLGVTTVTFAGGLATSVTRFGDAVDRADAVQAQVRPNNATLGGVAAHRLILPMAGRAAKIDLPASLFHVWNPAALTAMALAGVAVAVLDALIPSRTAARLPIAEVLHNE